jgi:hypothetical protein
VPWHPCTFCTIEHIGPPIADVFKVHDTGVIVVLSNPDFLSDISVQVCERMGVVVPTSKARVETAPEHHTVVDDNSFVMVGPVCSLDGSDDVCPEDIVFGMSHELDHVRVNAVHMVDSMLGVEGEDFSDLLVYDPIDLDTSLSSTCKSRSEALEREVHSVEPPLLVLSRWTTKEKFRGNPPTPNRNTGLGVLQRLGQSVKVIFAINEPLDFIVRGGIEGAPVGQLLPLTLAYPNRR